MISVKNYEYNYTLLRIIDRFIYKDNTCNIKQLPFQRNARIQKDPN